MKPANKFSQRLTDLYRRCGMSQRATVEDIKEKTGITIHQTSFSEYMRGAKQPTLQAALALALYYGVTVEWLAGEVDVTGTAESMAKRLAELDYSEEAQEAAEVLDQLPPEHRTKWVADIKAAYRDYIENQQSKEQWERLARFVEKMDSGDVLRQRIEDETGVRLSLSDG